MLAWPLLLWLSLFTAAICRCVLFNLAIVVAAEEERDAEDVTVLWLLAGLLRRPP